MDLNSFDWMIDDFPHIDIIIIHPIAVDCERRYILKYDYGHTQVVSFRNRPIRFKRQ
jgi:hypothetical protein